MTCHNAIFKIYKNLVSIFPSLLANLLAVSGFLSYNKALTTKTILLYF